MSVSPVRLPPSSRDFEIFRLVNIQEVSQRQAAAQMNLSPTRVRQIVQKVEEFMKSQTCLAPEQPRDVQLRLAEMVASERVNLLFGESLRSWENSQGMLTTTRCNRREGQPESVTETTQPSQGKVMYLNAALRYALAAGKLPVARLNTLAGSDEEETDCSSAEESWSEEVSALPTTPAFAAKESSHPPVEDCALFSANDGKLDSQTSATDGVNNNVAISYDEQRSAPVGSQQCPSPPAQRNVPGASAASNRRASSPSTNHRPLTTSQRRSRNRFFDGLEEFAESAERSLTSFREPAAA